MYDSAVNDPPPPPHTHTHTRFPLCLPGSCDCCQVCAARAKGEGPGHGEAHGYMNRKNVGKRSLSWDQMERYPDGLADNLRRLAGELGYVP